MKAIKNIWNSITVERNNDAVAIKGMKYLGFLSLGCL